MTESDAPAISVVISTYNRANDLRETLSSLLVQTVHSSAFEVLVVDNNSTDDTRVVIEEAVTRSRGRFHYLLEQRQGVSYGRNTGILAARGAIIAFTDDDVIVAPEWVANIKQAFETYADVDYLTGKILPQFGGTCPAWLTLGNSGPCTIRDRGDAPILGDRGRFFPGWATANLAIRRALLERAGLFATDFLRGEDLEFILRVWRAGGRGMYAPDVVITHKIPRERMAKPYHRMWHLREGDIRARVRYHELFDRDGRLTSVPRKQVFGIPLFLFARIVRSAGEWARATIRRDEADAFFHESQLRQTFSYLRRRIRDAWPPSGPSRSAGLPALLSRVPDHDAAGESSNR